MKVKEKKQKLMDCGAANAAFYKLLDYAETHIFDKIRIEYFAVSLPDFLIFDENLDRKNKAHCYYLMALGNIGLGNYKKAMEFLEKVKEFDFNHLNSVFYRKNIVEGKINLLYNR